MNSWYEPTSPQSEPPWSPPDNRRSTWALVETCILTLILCSWTAIHLDIPPERRRDSISRWMWKRLKWSIVGILAPEYLLWMASTEYWESRQICLELGKEESEKVDTEMAGGGVILDTNRSPTAQSLPESNDTASSPVNSSGNLETHSSNYQVHSPNDNGLTHAYGGSIRITRFEDLPKRPNDEKTTTATITPDTPNTLTYERERERGFYIEMGGYELVPTDDEPELPEGFCGRVTSRGAIALYRSKQLPHVPLELIKDQSKTDILAKFVVCLQASWMVIQCFARVAQALPLTLLEINTMMHVMCALIMFLLWFRKPHDLIIPTQIPVNTEKLQQLKAIVKYSHPQLLSESGASSCGLKLTEPSNDKASSVDLGSCRTSQYYNAVLYGGILGLFISTIYGGVHLAVWNGHFPTHLERVLWRISGLIILGMPFFLATFLSLIWRIQKHFEKGNKNGNGTGFWSKSKNGTRYHLAAELPNPKQSSSYWRSQYSPHVEFLKYLKRHSKRGWCVSYMSLIILQIIASLCYGLARAFLVFEAFASLRNLPAGSYNAVNWTSFIPHI